MCAEASAVQDWFGYNANELAIGYHLSSSYNLDVLGMYGTIPLSSSFMILSFWGLSSVLEFSLFGSKCFCTFPFLLMFLHLFREMEAFILKLQWFLFD